MNRLQFELERLFGLGVEGQAATRALILELALPADWEALGAVWKGVQSDLDLPAPAIAVSGVDGLQLWFSSAAPVASRDGTLFLEGLRARYLAQVKPAHVRALTQPAAFPPAPPVERSPERWSAFVTPDLASVFSDTPWLDTPPSDDAQAAILRPLRPMPQAAFDAALQLLAETGGDTPAPSPPPLPGERLDTPAVEHPDADPARFLAGVMNDATAPLALRIEAAKALLADPRRRQTPA